MADRIGQHFGNYLLVLLLGKGGFAEVYLGEHEQDHTRVAVKVLQTRLINPEDLKAFIREARTFRLIHPNIVRLLDFDIGIDDSPFLVMEYAPNGTLHQRYPRGSRLPLETVVTYVKQVAAALQYAHDKGLIHRDVKPENMLLAQHNKVLLSDFGIAAIAHSTSSMSVQAATGTIPYMAPEQLQAHPLPASDQYSLGIVVYEWLTGACPFHGSFTEIASQHLFVPPPPLREKLPTLSPAVEQVVMIALAKDPHQRFGSVQAFATAFEQACQMETAQTLPASLSSQPTIEVPLPSPSQQPTELVTRPGDSHQTTERVSPPGQTAIPTELSPSTRPIVLPADARKSSNESQHATEMVASPDQASVPKDVVSQAVSTGAVTPSLDLSGVGERAHEVVEERSPEEEQLREAREEQARRTKEERAQQAREKRLRKAEEERAQKARAEQAPQTAEENSQGATEERTRQTKKEHVPNTRRAHSPIPTLLAFVVAGLLPFLLAWLGKPFIQLSDLYGGGLYTAPGTGGNFIWFSILVLPFLAGITIAALSGRGGSSGEGLGTSSGCLVSLTLSLAFGLFEGLSLNNVVQDFFIFGFSFVFLSGMGEFAYQKLWGKRRKSP